MSKQFMQSVPFMTFAGRSYPKVSSSRKASSTPSLPEATTDGAKPLVESFEQTVSADNLSSKQVRNLLKYLKKIFSQTVLYLPGI
jgi:hypothetical protein